MEHPRASIAGNGDWKDACSERSDKSRAFYRIVDHWTNAESEGASGQPQDIATVSHES
jgi:hypothetical protein